MRLSHIHGFDGFTKAMKDRHDRAQTDLQSYRVDVGAGSTSAPT